MKKLIIVLIIVSFALPVQAGMVLTPDPVDKNLIENERLNQEMTKGLNKPGEPLKIEEKKSGSSWWKWALGIAIVGGIAAAAGGHGGGGGGSNGGGGSTGNGTISW
jgi:uncharacterized protein YneF (UPF0154 family)